MVLKVLKPRHKQLWIYVCRKFLQHFLVELKIIIGGIKKPAALTAQTTVVFTPLSPLITAPTWCLPFRAITFCSLFCTVVKPDSSTLNIVFAVMRLPSTVLSSMLQKIVNTVSVEPLSSSHWCSFWLSEGKLWIPSHERIKPLFTGHSFFFVKGVG